MLRHFQAPRCYIHNNNNSRRYDVVPDTLPIKSQFPGDKLARLNVNEVPSRKRRKSYELRLNEVPGTYARTVSAINDYNVRRAPFVLLLRSSRKWHIPLNERN